MKRIGLQVLKVISGFAAVVFWFVPLATLTQALIFVASIAVMLICIALSNALDDQNNAGYWPEGPIDWNPRAEADRNSALQTRKPYRTHLSS